MKVTYGIGKVKKVIPRAVLVIGVFDGLHLGHQELIQRAIRRARELKGPVVVMTFWPHPVQVLRPEVNLPLIISLPYRLKLLEDLGVAQCIVIHFTKKFSQLTPEKFIKNFLMSHLKPQEIFVGDDFRFGQNRSGSLECFQMAGHQYGFKVNVLPSIDVAESLSGKKAKRKISSTMIRQLIAQGELKKIKSLLGRNMAIMGKVKRGEARGKTLGFPTANIYPQNEIVLPLGVYAVHVWFQDRRFQGMADVGLQPSFKISNERVAVEVFIFDFHKNLYGHEIIVEFIKKIREERMFYTKEELIAQLQKDEIKARAILRA
ncbi:MAG: riboflavin biosynthesis protein RibF [Omnitrophica WOR_2 bacterium GWA2_45_18]|nr:MAG: riboflavin biosynthesis protein RibF [Omnitrophica WOR_2 bacterium GWA2_45_18]